MDHVRTAPLAGIAGALAVVLFLAYPYVAADGGVGAYYSSGVVNPLVAGLLALVAVIVLAAGRENRTEPALAAGVALIFGAFVTGLLLLWALTVRIDAVAISPVHRWVTVTVSLALPIAGLWYAKSLRLV